MKNEGGTVMEKNLDSGVTLTGQANVDSISVTPKKLKLFTEVNIAPSTEETLDKAVQGNPKLFTEVGAAKNGDKVVLKGETSLKPHLFTEVEEAVLKPEKAEKLKAFSRVNARSVMVISAEEKERERRSSFAEKEIDENRQKRENQVHDSITKTAAKEAENNLNKEKEGLISSIVTECFGFKSGNFELKLNGIKEEILELSQKSISRIYYQFTIVMSHGQFMASVISSELESFKWVKEATAGRAYFREKKDGADFASYVHEVIEENINNVKHEKCYKTNGWKSLENGDFIYVCNIGVLGRGEMNIRAQSDLKFQIDSQTNMNDNLCEYLKMKQICKKPEIAECLMTFVNLSVITTLFEIAGYPIKFILGIMGTTNTLKTSMALVFSRIFNALEVHSPEVTFSSTCAGIETFVAKYSDSVLLVDDFMPGSDRGKQYELNGKLELLCRLYGDRTSKKRMTVFAGKEVDFPVRGCCMITGEHMTGVESSRTRILTLNIEKGDVNSTVLNYFQENPLVLPTYLYGFIQFVTANIKNILQMIRDNVKQYRHKLNFHIARLNEAAALLLTAQDIMFMHWKNCNLITDITGEKERWADNILKIIVENDKKLSQVNLVTIILQALEEELLNRPERLTWLENIKKDDVKGIYEDQDFFYIPQKELYLITKEFCRTYDINFYLQPNMITEKLKEKGLLECFTNKAGHVESSRKLKQGKGITRRFLYIKKQKIKEIIENNHGEI